ncbi:hypothetical protein L7F22_034671 [Adiantum nelumboides]|nr:hypothetical protein [Adiantum nelumboides]
MRAVVQRVLSAKVVVDGETISQIGPGILVLVGLLESDVDSDADFICRKALNMRIFPNEQNGKAWDQSVMQRSYEVLLVSQFTLYGIMKGNKPDFHVAMTPQLAKPFYDSLVEKFRKAYVRDRVKGLSLNFICTLGREIAMQGMVQVLLCSMQNVLTRQILEKRSIIEEKKKINLNLRLKPIWNWPMGQTMYKVCKFCGQSGNTTVAVFSTS